jgi:Flp pilus assembly protein TadG
MMKTNYSKNQRGVVTVLVVMALPVLLLIMGLALDFGHVFVNKTRLQNALDATALSAAIAINGDIGKDSAKEMRATAAGRATFNCFIGKTTGCVTPGNGELKGLDEGTLVFEYSKTLNPWGTFDPATDAFAFVKVTSTNMLNVTPVLIRIMDEFNDDMPIPARATAGAVGNNCELMPFVLCAAIPVDKDCSDGNCYGYNMNTMYALTQAQNKVGGLTAGNFGLLDFNGNGGGASEIRDALKGTTVNACPLNNNLPLDSKPGESEGGVRSGINYRIDTMDTNHDNYLTNEFYTANYTVVPPAKKAIRKISDLTSNKPPYTYYRTSQPYTDYKAAGGNDKRVIAVPFGNCTEMFKPGSSSLPQVGTACMFLTQHVANSDYYVDAMFLGSCEVGGAFSPTNPVLNGPYKIVLFKSSGSGDS